MPAGRGLGRLTSASMPRRSREEVFEFAAFDVWMRLSLRAAKSRLTCPTQEVGTRTPLAAFMS